MVTQLDAYVHAHAQKDMPAWAHAMTFEWNPSMKQPSEARRLQGLFISRQVFHWPRPAAIYVSSSTFQYASLMNFVQLSISTPWAA
jgi:hypothetical protein